MPASGASLLLNAEGVFTAVLAWLVFRENFDRRIALGMMAIVAGAVLLSVPDGAELGSPWPALAVLGACLFWGLDNNLTRKIALNDATWLAAVKGLGAGPVNLMLAFALGATLPAAGSVAAALVVGFFAYGVSLVLFIVGMRHVGTARAGAYFSIAPFFGAPWRSCSASRSPGSSDRRAPHGIRRVAAPDRTPRHEHTHEAVVHDHWHTHDEHHQHEHPEARSRRHPPQARALTRAPHPSHEHYPDAHHRHRH